MPRQIYDANTAPNNNPSDAQIRLFLTASSHVLESIAPTVAPAANP